MTKIIFGVLYFVATAYMAWMAAAFTILGHIWLGFFCLVTAALFLVLLYKDGIMAYDD